MGIMVGRGTSPVKFDTQKFQRRLETIAGDFGKKSPQKKMDLKFYDVLDHPVPEELAPPKNKPLEIIPKKETSVIPDQIPFKASRKKQTFKFQNNTAKTDEKPVESLPPNDLKSVRIMMKSTRLKESAATKERPDKIVPKGVYTLQVAAYKAFKDAVTQMTILEKKGFHAYRVKGEKDGVIWYRIRTGSFATYDEAKQLKKKLDKAKINSIIIKRDKDEDING